MKTKLVLAAVAVTGAVALPVAGAGAQSPYYQICATGQTPGAAPYYCITKTPAKHKKATKSVSLTVSPARDKKKPYKYTAHGKVHKPASASKRRACTGSVRVAWKKGNGKVVKKKTVKLGKNCKYTTGRTRVPGKPLKKRGKLHVRATFMGNKHLKAKKSKSETVKYGKKHH